MQIVLSCIAILSNNNYYDLLRITLHDVTNILVELVRLSEWLEANKLALNMGKSKYMFLS